MCVHTTHARTLLQSFYLHFSIRPSWYFHNHVKEHLQEQVSSKVELKQMLLVKPGGYSLIWQYLALILLHFFSWDTDALCKEKWECIFSGNKLHTLTSDSRVKLPPRVAADGPVITPPADLVPWPLGRGDIAFAEWLVRMTCESGVGSPSGPSVLGHTCIYHIHPKQMWNCNTEALCYLTLRILKL